MLVSHGAFLTASPPPPLLPFEPSFCAQGMPTALAPAPPHPALIPDAFAPSSSDRGSTSSPRTPPLSRSLSTASPSPVLLSAMLHGVSDSEQESKIAHSKPPGARPSASDPLFSASIDSDPNHDSQDDTQSTPAAAAPQQVPGALTTGKGGCWTCRIRRKKCDEQRVGEKRACQMCTRLRIDCLGWGPKRPAWMRDKQAVETYKAGIKEKLIKAGMVRGQPRLQSSASGSSPSTKNTSSPRSNAQMRSNTISHPTSRTSPSELNTAYGQSSLGRTSYGQSGRSMTSPAAFGGGLGAIGTVGPVGALGAMASGSGGAYEWEQYPSHHSGPYGGQGYGQHRYDPYPSHAPRAQQTSTNYPQASAVMGVTAGSDYDYLSPHGISTAVHDEERRRRAHRLSLQSQHSGLSEIESSYNGGSSHGNHSPSFGGQSSSNLLSFNDTNAFEANRSMSQGINSYGVPGIGLSNSPMMMSSAEDSLLFPPGNGTFGAATSPSRTSTDAGLATGTDVTATSSLSISTIYGTAEDPLIAPALVDPHVAYYFESILSMQYVFGTGKARDVLNNLFVSDPYGPLVNASCALAAKHNKVIRVSRGIDQPDADPRQSTSQQFFEKAQWQLSSASLSQSLTASHALASLHLAAYFLMTGGMGDWAPHIELARAWLSQLGAASTDNERPEESFALLTDAEQLAAKMTIWYDVVSAISTRSTPRFLALYRRLFGHTISRERQPSGFSMDHLMGCPGDILLIYAETAALADWKVQQELLGMLDRSELLTRGAAIESRLLVSSIAVSNASMSKAGSTVSLNSHSPSLASASSASILMGTPPIAQSLPGAAAPLAFANDNAASKLYYSVTRVFLDAASLFLASVVNDATPNNADVRSSVRGVLETLQLIPERTIDRALALPLTLVGSLCETTGQREFVYGRLRMLEEVIGNMRSVRLILERAWTAYDTRGGSVDWHGLMKNDLGLEILLI